MDTKNLGYKRMLVPKLFWSKFVQIRLVLAEIFHYIEIGQMWQGQMLPCKMSKGQLPPNTDDRTNEVSKFG